MSGCRSQNHESRSLNQESRSQHHESRANNPLSRLDAQGSDENLATGQDVRRESVRGWEDGIEALPLPSKVREFIRRRA